MRARVLPEHAASLLRHRPPALVLGTLRRFDGTALACDSRGAGPWAWPALLEGTAQAAGLLAGLQDGGPDNSAVIAEIRDVLVRVDGWAGVVRFEAILLRRVLGFWRCRASARGEAGALLLEATVTVAAPRGRR